MAVVSYNIDPVTAESIRLYAKEQQRSASFIADKALGEFVDRLPKAKPAKRGKPIRKGSVI